jgi:formyl-CoA transferase/CoA:oxalate CoA-transferase
MTAALEGIRVLDFTRQMAGPYGTQLLSDYGADVIKFESLPGGDPSRTTGIDFVGDDSALFLMWNRGKRSIAVDLRKPRSIEIVKRLAAIADVVVENYRPGVADEIGIGYSALSGINPRLIYCSVSAFGPDGPLAPYPGTDPVVQAISGVMSVTGEADRTPVLVGIPIADFTGAMLCAQGVLLALVARERTGRGQKVDVSMLHGLISALTTRLASFWATGRVPQRHGSAHSVVVPYQAFQTKDGYVVAGVWGAGEGWPRFCAAVARPDLLADQDFATNGDRVRNRDRLTSILNEEFSTRTSAEWEERFHNESALFGPIMDFEQLFNSAHVKATETVTSVEHQRLGTIPQLRPAISMSETPGAIQFAPPVLGQHTMAVLHDAGYTETEIENLLHEKIVVAAETKAASTQ